MSDSSDVDLCGVCKRVYSESVNIPRLLECLHVFCQVCMGKYVTEDKSKIECPTCKEHTELSQTSIESLPVDKARFRQMQLLYISKPAKGVPCHDCPDKANAHYFCTNCNFFQCQDCRDMHINPRNSVSRDHRVISSADVTREILKAAEKVPECADHDQPLIFFCQKEECNVPICTGCAVFEHEKLAGHQITKIKDVYKEGKQRLEGLLGVSSRNANRLKSRLNREMEWIAKLEKEKQTCNFAVDEECKKLIAVVEERKKKLKEYIESGYNALLRQLQSNINSFKMDLRNLEDACALANTTMDYGTEFEILTTSSAIEKRFETLNKFANVELPMTAYKLEYRPRTPEGIIQALDETKGCISTMSPNVSSIEITTRNAQKSKRSQIAEVTLKNKANLLETVDVEDLAATAKDATGANIACEVEQTDDGLTHLIYATPTHNGKHSLEIKVFGHILSGQMNTFHANDGENSEDELASEEYSDTKFVRPPIPVPRPRSRIIGQSSSSEGITKGVIEDIWEIPKGAFRLDEKLGKGQFYNVVKGTRNVAIKILQEGKVLPTDFQTQVKIMKTCRHDNIVRLYGVSTKTSPFYIITELLNCNLLDYLKGSTGSQLELLAVIYMAAQIASGMAFLGSHLVVHRDLGARNILVGNSNIVKITGFGFAKITENCVYMAEEGNKTVAIKWTAPEAIFSDKFSVKSDVWSYGILLVELVTKGAVPYQGMKNVEVIRRVQKGYRMPRVPFCPESMYEMILKCWKTNPEERPTFEFLSSFFDDFAIATQPQDDEVADP